MPDLNHSIAVHTKVMNTWWTKKEYILARKAFIRRNPICIRCGRPSTTPGHSAADYSSYETYLWVVNNDMADPVCNACNLCEKKGLRPCPVCVREKKIKIRYIRPEQDYCFDHRPEAEKVKSRERKEVFKQLVKQSHSIQNAKRRAIYQEMKQRGR